METAGLGIWRLDVASGSVVWNDQLLAIYGITRQEFADDLEAWRAQIHPEDAGVAEAELARIVEGEPVFGVEFRILRGDGEVRHITASGTPLRNEDGEVVELLGIHIDVTEIRREEEAVREREAFLGAIVEHSPSAILVADEGGQYRTANPAAAELFGMTTQELESLSVQDLPILAASVDEHIDRFMAKGEASGEVTVQHADGTRRQARYQAIRVAPDFNLSILSDITRMRRAETESQRAQTLRSLGVMAGGIAHDFNNIMTAVIGNLDLLRPGVESGTEWEELLDEAHAAAVRTRGLARRLLTFSKGGGPITTLEPLEEVVRHGIEPVVAGSSVEVAYEFADGLPPVQVDRHQFAQVAGNLAANAVQAMPDGGPLRVSGRAVEVDGDRELPLEPGTYAELVVHDHGQGIAPDVLPRIFEPYFTTREMGHGLGLSICHSVVEKHGGHILVESELGVGSAVTVYLPVGAEDAGSAPPPAE